MQTSQAEVATEKTWTLICSEKELSLISVGLAANAEMMNGALKTVETSALRLGFIEVRDASIALAHQIMKEAPFCSIPK